MTIKFGIAALVMSAGLAQHSGSLKMPKEGWVTDKETAIAIGVAVAKKHLGVKNIESQAPYHAYLEKGVWCVTRQSSVKNDDGSTRIHFGSFVVHVSSRDGRVLFVGRDI